MINQFNNKFNLPAHTLFKRCELEDVIIKQYGSIQYYYRKQWTDISTNTKYPETYSCGTQFCWECNEIESDINVICKSPEEALMNMIITNNLYKIVEVVYESTNNVR